MLTVEYAVFTVQSFTVQSVIFYRVNLFAMPGMQCVVYALEYKDVESPCYNQLLFTAYCHD